MMMPNAIAHDHFVAPASKFPATANTAPQTGSVGILLALRRTPVSHLTPTRPVILRAFDKDDRRTSTSTRATNSAGANRVVRGQHGFARPWQDLNQQAPHA
jgi:hypothetical protein